MQYTITDTGTNDFSEFDFDELQELARLVQSTDLAVRAEIARRGVIEAIPAQIEQLAGQYLNATGREPGAEWVQPEGAHDAYPLGWQVTYEGKVWESLIAGNPYKPGVSGWREVVAEGAVPEWVQPTGAHDAYALGAEVLHDGKRWVSIVDANVWRPCAAGSETLWEEVVEESEEPTDPEEPEEPAEPEPEEPGEEPGEPSVAEWNPNGVNYTRDAQVTFEGVTYVCLQPHASQPGWTPAAVPALWAVV